jgi:hypothetical protein
VTRPGRRIRTPQVSYWGRRVCVMPRGRPSPKLAITVDAEVHERVLAAAADEGVSVSAWMTAAARRALLVPDGLRAVAEWEEEHGELTEAELGDARRRVADQLIASGHARSAWVWSTTLEPSSPPSATTARSGPIIACGLSWVWFRPLRLR